MLRNRLTLSLLLIIGMLSVNAHAYQIPKWKDPVTGLVTYGYPLKAPGIHVNAEGHNAPLDERHNYGAPSLQETTEVHYDADGNKISRRHLSEAPTSPTVLRIPRNPIDTPTRDLILTYVESNPKVNCDDACEEQQVTNALAAQTALLGGARECKRLARWYTGDIAGKRLALSARKECVDAKARAALGLPGNGGNAVAASREHFDFEGDRRNRQTDRAIQINEGWQNRAAMDRNTSAIENGQRDAHIRNRNAQWELERQTRSLESIDRKLRY